MKKIARLISLFIISSPLFTHAEQIQPEATMSEQANQTTQTKDDNRVGNNKTLSLTLYDDLAFVRDNREVTLPAGTQQLKIGGLSEQTLFNSLYIQSPLKIKQLFHSNKEANNNDVLADQLQKTVGVLQPDGHYKDGKLISYNPKNIVLLDNRYLLDVPSSHLAIYTLPDEIDANLRLHLYFDELAEETKIPLNINYLTYGINWHAQYTFLLNPSQNTLNLNAKVVISNQTAIDFPLASVQLAAAKKQRYGAMPMAMSMLKSASVAESSMARADMVEESDVSNLHLYTLPNAISIKAHGDNTFNLFDVNNVSYISSYRINEPDTYQFMQRQKIDDLPVIETLHIKNDEQNQLGRVFPKGEVNFFMNDEKGVLQYIGNESLSTKGKNQAIDLSLGVALNLTGKVFLAEKNKTEETYHLLLNNGQDSSKTVDYYIAKHSNNNERNLVAVESNAVNIIDTGDAWKISIELTANSEKEIKYTKKFETE